MTAEEWVAKAKWACAANYTSDGSLILLSERVPFLLGTDLSFPAKKTGSATHIALYEAAFGGWPVHLMSISSHYLTPNETLTFPGGATLGLV